MKELKTHRVLDLQSRLMHLFNMGRLFALTQRPERTDDQFTVRVLTQDGRELVQTAVQYCLKRGVAPNCSVSGDDGRCDGDVHGLNMLEYQDLIEKLESIVTRPIPR